MITLTTAIVAGARGLGLQDEKNTKRAQKESGSGCIKLAILHRRVYIWLYPLLIGLAVWCYKYTRLAVHPIIPLIIIPMLTSYSIHMAGTSGRTVAELGVC